MSDAHQNPDRTPNPDCRFCEGTGYVTAPAEAVARYKANADLGYTIVTARPVRR